MSQEQELLLPPQQIYDNLIPPPPSTYQSNFRNIKDGSKLLLAGSVSSYPGSVVIIIIVLAIMLVVVTIMFIIYKSRLNDCLYQSGFTTNPWGSSIYTNLPHDDHNSYTPSARNMSDEELAAYIHE